MPGVDPISLPPDSAARPVDLPRMTAAVRELLIGMGEDPDRDGLRDTPERVAKSLAELTQGLRQQPAEALATTFDLGHQELILVRDIAVQSLCEHHMLPFHGVAHIGYLPGPDGRITGLSKLARLVDVFARRLQVQERLTTQIADAMCDVLNPNGVIVVIEAEHLCMSMRGVQKPGARTVTSAVRGHLLNPATRAEAMALLNRPA